jgi:hypothetical protein
VIKKKRIKRTTTPSLNIVTQGDRANLNPVAEAFMRFCKEEMGWEFVDVKHCVVDKKGKVKVKKLKTRA